MLEPCLPVNGERAVSGRHLARRIIPGGTKSARSEYGSWWGAIQRCTNPRHPSFARYGGRGITVCARWLASFAHFFDDMGPKPSAAHSLDRIDNAGNYEPGNCRWATWQEQAANRSNTPPLSDAHRAALRLISDFAREGAQIEPVDIGVALGLVDRDLDRCLASLVARRLIDVAPLRLRARHEGVNEAHHQPHDGHAEDRKEDQHGDPLAGEPFETPPHGADRTTGGAL